MKVSRPQERMYPVVKCGSPALIVTKCSSLRAGSCCRAGDGGGNGADGTTPVHCTVPRAKPRTSADPSRTNLKF